MRAQQGEFFFMSNLATLTRSSDLPDGALRLADDTVLLFGPVNFRLNKDSVISLEGQPLKGPYPGLQFTAAGKPSYLLLLQSPQCRGRDLLSQLTIQLGQQTTTLPPRRINSLGTFTALLDQCDNEALGHIASFLLALTYDHPEQSWHPLLQTVRNAITAPALTLSHGAWLNPQTLYVEGEIRHFWPDTSPKLLIHHENGNTETPAHLFQTAERGYALIATLPEPLYTEPYQEFTLSILSGTTLFPVEGAVSQKAYGLEFCQHLNAKSDYQKDLIRESVNRFLIDATTNRSALSDLLAKLQRFITATPVSCIDGQLPFNFHVENIIPAGLTGLFVSGWMRDPLQLVERIEIISALGFSMPLETHLHRYPRPDIEDGFRQTAYGHMQEKHGFLGFAPLPENRRNQLEGLAELQAFRFKITLKGGGIFEITPEPRYRDAQAARQFLLKSFPTASISNSMLAEAFAPALTHLQTQYLQTITIAERVDYRLAQSKPDISLIIPLYRNLSLAQTQLALLANDPFLQQCELLYVLDSPEQADEAKRLFEGLAALYNLPLSLLILSQNAGFAQAVNLAAKHAKAPHLLIMQSDVLPHKSGWLTPLVNALESMPESGIAAPVLLFEDESLEQAGQQVTKRGSEYGITADFQGYASDYAPAKTNRITELLDSACLLIRRAVFERIGGFSPDLIAGHRDGADLCFKIRAIDGKCIVAGESRLYHLTRQSVTYSEFHHQSLAPAYDDHLFTTRWHKQLGELVEGKS